MTTIDVRFGDAGRTPASLAVSVIIPAYNSAQFICEALDSVFAQDFSDHETILVNDGSPDTEHLEEVLAPCRDRIIYLKQENRGPAAARNAAIRTARGEYVAFLDSDDAWLPNYLSVQMRALRGDPGLDLVYSDAIMFGDSTFSGGLFSEHNPSRGEANFESLVRWDCTVITSCTVARKEALVAAGLFDESFYHAEDFDLWLRLAHRGGRIGYHKEVLAKRRLHGASLGAQNIALLAGEIRVYEKLLRTLSLSRELRELTERQMERRRAELAIEQGKQQLRAGRYAEAVEEFTRANDLFQRRKLRYTILGLRIAPRLFRHFYNLRETRA